MCNVYLSCSLVSPQVSASSASSWRHDFLKYWWDVLSTLQIIWECVISIYALLTCCRLLLHYCSSLLLLSGCMSVSLSVWCHSFLQNSLVKRLWAVHTYAALGCAARCCAALRCARTSCNFLPSAVLGCAALVLVTTCISMEPFTHTLRCTELVETFFCFY